ncbi:MAG: hypothetical protein B7X90_02105 [Novosphingobium sp. 17-62-19]|nr:MAG: hypothetical protein B7Y74_08830 [Novosphingobium sp. 35-62-5]OZA21449.1 MAG: hypothetical protein B7X90_02105 [Novosphingobium sp. 17-62-19]OZA65711.1 MAG: hypothetical protein B7X78_04815 [Sphingomonadales bacterium 39-62-4]
MLRTALGPEIAAWLEDASVIEVMLNPDGRLWIDRLGAGIADTGSGMSAADGERIIRLVAHHVGAEVHGRSPRVSAELPDTGERFEGLLPPVVAAPSFAIRKPAVAVFTLTDYVGAEIMSGWQADALVAAVATRKNILVAGGTSTGKTAFMAERVLGNVVSSGNKVLVLAVIVGIGSTIFSEFTSAIAGEPTIEDALSIVLASLSLLGLGIFGPGIANGIVSGGPQLGAGAAAGTALLAGGAAAGAVAGAKLAGGAVASAASNVAHGTSRTAGGATMAYALGSAGKSGASAVGSGMAAVGDAAVGAATSPLRKAGDGMKQSFREGSRAAITNTGGSITPGPNTPPPPPPTADAGQPAWAKAMKDRQTIAHGATIAAHTLKSGDSHGGGASIDTSEKD